MPTINELPQAWRDVSKYHLSNFFTCSRGRDGLAQIWFGRPTFGTAVSMADSDYPMNTRDVPKHIDQTALEESQAWFSQQDLGSLGCDVPPGLTVAPPVQHDIAHILLYIIKPAIRAIAISCLRYKWLGYEESIARYFTAAYPDMPYHEKLGEWIEEYGLGGVMSKTPSGLHFEPAIMPKFVKESSELETLDWSNPQYPFLPFKIKESEVIRPRRPRLEDYPEILEYMRLNGGENR